MPLCVCVCGWVGGVRDDGHNWEDILKDLILSRPTEFENETSILGRR